nr:S-formylglutathione hydrolase [Ipomoea batatas]
MSAFAPILTPVNCPWSQKACTNCLGENIADLGAMMLQAGSTTILGKRKHHVQYKDREKKPGESLIELANSYKMQWKGEQESRDSGGDGGRATGMEAPEIGAGYDGKPLLGDALEAQNRSGGQ